MGSGLYSDGRHGVRSRISPKYWLCIRGCYVISSRDSHSYSVAFSFNEIVKSTSLDVSISTT